MRTASLYNIIFNRKAEKLDPDDMALVQIEIVLPDRRKKYISTGIKIKPEQWDQRTHLVCKHPTSALINKNIRDIIAGLRNFEMTLNAPVTPDDIDRYMKSETTGTITFADFIKQSLERRATLDYTTIKRHERTIERLRLSGIISFSDLTYSKIQDFDDLLKKEKGLHEQSTIYKVHGVVKTYINLAIRAGIMRHDQNPYARFQVEKGRHKIRTRLDDDQIGTILTKDVPPLLQLNRDLYVFQLFTGVAYSDLQRLSKSNLRHTGGDTWIEGLRKKSGEYYAVFLLPEALELIARYADPDRELLFICPSLTQQNARLKLVADLCGINKNITTHTARHSFATMMLRKGVSLGVIQSQLGHAKIETTQIYAKMEHEVIREQMRKLQ